MELTVIQLLPTDTRGGRNRRFRHALGEIRLRAGRPVSLSGGGENLRLPVCATSEQLSRLLTMFCDSSYHAHEQTLREGYVTYRGCRVGIGGIYSQTGLPSSVTSLCIRIQRHIRGAALPLVKTLAERDFSEGVIVYSPPGYGKTTLLRDLAAIISAPPILRNVAVVDNRRELEDEGLMRGCTVDIIAGTARRRVLRRQRERCRRILLCATRSARANPPPYSRRRTAAFR